MAWIYLTPEQAIAIHAKTIEVSGGGLLGHRDINILKGVLHHIQNDEYYPTFDSKLTHLFHSGCTFHCFADGNKRIAIALSAQLLIFNGYVNSVTRFMRDAENISYHVAAGCISKELLGEWMLAMLNGELEDESLKLSIFNAITSCEIAGVQPQQDNRVV